MNKSIHQRLNAHIIAAAAAVALAVPTASLARTVSVAAIRDGTATAAFGNADGKAYTLAWGYGNADGGATTNAWAHFETLGTVAANAATASYPLPAGWGDTVTNLRFFLLEPELPAAATRVEFIEATGTQWIDTGVNGETGLKFRADLEWDASHNGKADWVLVGARNGTATSDHTRIVPVYIEKAVCFGYGMFVRTTTPAVLGVRHEIVTDYTDGSAVSIARDGTPITGYESGYTPSTGNVDAGRNLYVFAANWGGSANLFAKARLYGLEIQRKNATTGALEPVRNFVPCTTNGVACLYDTVERRYYGNSGTGSFLTGATMATPNLVIALSATASSDAYAAPDEYLDYVQSSGSQWIDTDVIGRIGVEAELDVAPVSVNDRTVLGSRSGGSTHTRFYAVHWANGGLLGGVGGLDATDGKQYWYWGNRKDIIYADTRYTIHSVLKNGELSIAVNGKTIATRTDETSFDSGCNMYLFACNVGGTADSAYRSSARLYGAKIWFDGELVRHFIPCRKNNRAAVYDKVSGRIFFPQGADLVAGPVLPRPVELVEWVQADGANGSRSLYVDTGVYGKSGVGMVADMEWATKPAGNAVESIFCGATSSDSKRFWLYDAVADSGNATATHRMGYDNWKLQIQTGSSIYVQTRYRVETFLFKGEQSLTVSTNAPNGAWIALSTRPYNDADVISTEQTLYVFANNNAGTAEPVYAEARLYSLVLTNELGVVRDFVPCVADNGRAGLYDRVSERVFFPQAAKSGATSNDFDPAGEIGAVTNVLAAMANAPSARLSYVESNGTSDYIDLGLIAKDGTKMLVDMEWTGLPDDDVFCGARVATSGEFKDTRFFLYNAYGSSGNPLHAMGHANGNATVGDAGYVRTGVRYRVETTLESETQTCTVRKLVDGAWSEPATRTSAFAGPLDTGLPLYLFARNLGGTPDLFAAARVYSLKLWQKNGNGDYELVRDLVPAKGPEGGAALWDRVTNRYFRNAGGRYGLTAGVESPWISGFMMRFR